MTAITNDPRLEPELLNDEVLITLKAGTCRRGDLKPVLLINYQLLPARPRSFLLATQPFRLGGIFLHARRLQRGAALKAFEPGDFILKRSVLSLKITHMLTKPTDLANQLFDKLAKIIVCEVVGRGRQHAQYESYPAPKGNREKILICPGSSLDYNVGTLTH